MSFNIVEGTFDEDGAIDSFYIVTDNFGQRFISTKQDLEDLFAQLSYVLEVDCG
jgi:hypothetical protein